MDVFESLIQTSTGRDKIFRATVGVASLAAQVVTGKSSTVGLRLANATDQLRSACIVLRLLEDLPMYRATCRQWSNQQESDHLAWLCGVLSSVSMQALLPFEHLMWAAEHNVLPIRHSSRWSTGIFVCASFASLFTLFKSFRKLLMLIQQGKRLKQRWLLESSHSRDADLDESRSTNDRLFNIELWTLSKAFADLIVSVNMLPTTTKYRCLWAGQIGRALSVSLAAFSAIVGLHLHIAATCRRA